MANDNKLTGIPVNYRNFILSFTSDPEEHGWKREDVEYILECIKNDTLDPSEFSCSEDDLYDSIGSFFDDGVCVEPDVNAAVYWYERAIEMDNDLACSNLAGILRKGSHGYPKDLARAFKLYSECGLPYTQIQESPAAGRGIRGAVWRSRCKEVTWHHNENAATRQRPAPQYRGFHKSCDSAC